MAALPANLADTLDSGAEDSDEVYALTEHGRTLHLVDGFDGDTTDMIGRRARCGRRMHRLAHPSDHLDGNARICTPCDKAEEPTP